MFYDGKDSAVFTKGMADPGIMGPRQREGQEAVYLQSILQRVRSGILYQKSENYMPIFNFVQLD
jgi:hypothetical protein